MINEIPFKHGEDNYIIHVKFDGANASAQVFKENGKPANGYIHSATYPFIVGTEKKFGHDAIQDIIESAKRDVIEGTWERVLKAFEEFRDKGH